MTAVNFAVEDGIVLAGPRGAVHLNLESAQQDIYLARADGYTFDIVGHLSSS